MQQQTIPNSRIADYRTPEGFTGWRVSCIVHPLTKAEYYTNRHIPARGRGAFFKAKYGGGGRGRGGGNDSTGASALPRGPPVYRHITELAKTLQRINGQSYGMLPSLYSI